MSRKGRTSACVLLFVLIGTACAGSADPSSWLEKRVCQFVFHGKTSHGERHHAPTFFPGDAMEAVRQLAFHADVPICTEELRPSGGEAIVPVEVNVKNASVGEILREVVAQDPRYAYRERLGVIEFFPRGADHDPANCLNMLIPAFKVRGDWNTVIQQLRCEVDIVAHDSRAVVPEPGCGGSYPGVSHPPAGIIEANFKNRSVREILDLLCARVGNMAWDAHFNDLPPQSTVREESRRLLLSRCNGISIGTDHPRPWMLSDKAPFVWFEGPPKSCLKCHYHQPCQPK